MGDHLVHGPARLAPANEGHDAVRAHLVAATHDRNVRAQPVGGGQRDRTIEVDRVQRLQLGHEAVGLADVEHVVEVGKPLEQRLAVLDRHASRHGDRTPRAIALPRDQLAELAVHLLLRVRAHRARDQHREVGVFQRHLRDEADVGELLGKTLAVGVVHLAADVPEVHPRRPAQRRHDRLAPPRASRHLQRPEAARGLAQHRDLRHGRSLPAERIAVGASGGRCVRCPGDTQARVVPRAE